MAKRETSIATPLAHLVGPGKLKVINNQLAYINSKEEHIRLDPRALTTLLCYGPVGITDQAFQILFSHGVEVAWMTAQGNRCKGRMVSADTSTTALRMIQHQVLAQPHHRLELARKIVEGKIQSQIDALRHYQRHGHPKAGALIVQLQQAIHGCKQSTAIDQVRGQEGTTSALWFRFFGTLLSPPWIFQQRQRRPPPDPVNALLSLGYTWVLNRAVAGCEAMGMESQLGALHDYRPGRPSMACDLMEPLRAPAVDRWLVPLLNRGQIQPEDFLQEKGGFRLKPEIFGRILHSWEQNWLDKKLQEALQHWIAMAIAFCRQATTLSTHTAP